MNRPDFIATLSAAVAVVAAPSVCVASTATSSKPLEYSGTIRMWEYEGGFPVVFARTAEDACRLAIGEDYGPLEQAKWRLVPPDESFTMLYDDAVPAGFEPDCTCDCQPTDLEKYGCECDASTASLTLPAATWAENKAARYGDVIGEYEG